MQQSRQKSSRRQIADLSAVAVTSSPLNRLTPGKAVAAVALIKSVHTLIFFGMGSCVLYILYSGLSGRVSRLTKASLAVVACESLIFFGNGMRCPLTNLAERLGSEHGTVGDIFLPGWFARRIPVVSTTLVATGIVGMGLHHLADSRRKRGAASSH